MADRLHFFLGGRDLEMQTIRALLEAEGCAFVDRGLGWGARVSAYRCELEAACAVGDTPVLVELEDDLELDERAVRIVDHHGERAGRDAPTSLEQVFTLLGLPKARWTRWMELVAANDRGHLHELARVGATLEEMRAVRRADREAQGVTEAEERAARDAVGDAELVAGGRLTLVRIPHAKTSPVADALASELGGPGYENLLVVSPEETNFYGSGMLVHALRGHFGVGAIGGALPERGYWTAPIRADDVIPFLVERLEADSGLGAL